MTLMMVLLEDEYLLQNMSDCTAAVGCHHVSSDVAFDGGAEHPLQSMFGCAAAVGSHHWSLHAPVYPTAASSYQTSVGVAILVMHDI